MRNLGLDLLRIVAVLLVLGRHLQLPPEPHPVLFFWAQGGWVGVDIFFVLSGFLVSSLLFREYLRTGSINIKRFLIRRGFKIYPAFCFLLVFSLCIRYYQGDLPTLRSFIGELFFLQNYLGGIWNHTWSLAVEEHFYIGIAILFAWLTTRRPSHNFDTIPLIFFVVSSTCFALRLLNLLIFPEYSNKAYLIGTHIRIDSLFFGVFLSYLFHFRGLEQKLSWIPSWALLLVGCLLLSSAFVFELEANKWLSISGVILFYLGSGGMLIAAIRLQEASAAPLRFLGMLGAASYSIYLWHMPVNIWGHALLVKITGIDNFYFYLFNYIIGSCVLGWFMNRLIEKPVLFVRDSYFPSNMYPTKVSEQSDVSEPQSFR